MGNSDLGAEDGRLMDLYFICIYLQLLAYVSKNDFGVLLCNASGLMGKL